MGIATDLGEFLSVLVVIVLIGFIAYITGGIFWILFLVIIIGFIVYRIIRSRKRIY